MIRPRLLIYLFCFLLPGSCARLPSGEGLTLTYNGYFTSVRGEKDLQSCYCFDGGYLDACGGGRIPLCFEEEAPAGDCARLEIWGAYVERPPAPGAGEFCPDGVRRIFLVERWVCHDRPGRADR